MVAHVARAAGSVPLSRVSPDLAVPLRPYLEAAAAEIIREIKRQVPEYARPKDSRYGQRMRWAAEQSVSAFIDAIGRPDPPWEAVSDIFAGIGAYEARKGRGLEGLQTSIRVGGQVACRRFIKDAQRLDWPLETLGQITDSLFVFLEKVAGAAGHGYARAEQAMATERERARHRLRDLLIMEPHASMEAISDLAYGAGWEVPRSLALVAIRRTGTRPVPVLSPQILADWHGPDPYLIVPDPEGPGQERLLASLARGHMAAIGPTVAVTRAGMSLRWARHALALVERGVFSAKEPVRCVDHIPTLAGAMCEELIDVALRVRLAPLLELPPQRREPLARTLLVYMENRDNAVAAAEQLLVHEQTVRYRIRRLEEILGDLPFDSAHRTELMLLLHSWVRISPPEDPVLPAGTRQDDAPFADAAAG
ncbi:PucR family transcriptional regulator [Actinomadura rudentiformis]|uniref:PucR family transcriptional regulator n=1 Tax=Actinomadura rudentiformis TaxID=359158 RepID=A0A6H9YL18_9ACTN|nr:helix-turn-helix domain-containing protein [Actinomadura rudentiformis]KAB2339966.1 PucR family transcriptional regulator [Actinomadura rudentiformis]